MPQYLISEPDRQNMKTNVVFVPFTAIFYHFVGSYQILIISTILLCFVATLFISSTKNGKSSCFFFFRIHKKKSFPHIIKFYPFVPCQPMTEQAKIINKNRVRNPDLIIVKQNVPSYF